MTYYIGIEDETGLYIPHSLSNDQKISQAVSDQWRFKIATEHATAGGIEPNTDMDFYLKMILVHVKKINADEIAQLNPVRRTILAHETLQLQN